MHEKLARKANLEDPIISALAEGRQPNDLSAEDAAVYAFCKEAHATGRFPLELHAPSGRHVTLLHVEVHPR